MYLIVTMISDGDIKNNLIYLPTTWVREVLLYIWGREAEQET